MKSFLKSNANRLRIELVWFKKKRKNNESKFELAYIGKCHSEPFSNWKCLIRNHRSSLILFRYKLSHENPC